MDLALVLTVLGGGLLVGFRKRSLTQFALFLFGSLALAGTALMSWERIFGLLPVAAAQAIVLFSFSFLAILLSLLKRQSPRLRIGETLALVGISLGLALILLISRMIASPVLESAFGGAGRLAAAEDNAKWLNFSSNLAQGNLIQLNDGTDGGLAALIICCSAIVSVIETYFGVLVGVQGVTISSVILSHNALVVLAPFAASPILASHLRVIFRKIAPHGPQLRRGVLILAAVLSAFIITASVAALVNFGHLSFQFVIVMLAFWALYMLNTSPKHIQLALVTFIGGSVALVWLPLPYFSLALSASALVVWLILRREFRRSTWLTEGALLGANIVVVFWLAMPKINYLQATTRPSVAPSISDANSSDAAAPTSSIDLVLAEGGTMSLRILDYILLLILLVALVVGIIRLRQHRWQLILAVYPVLLLVGFAASILAYDLLVAPSGWPHYGARKLSYGFAVVTIATLIPIFVLQLRFTPRSRAGIFSLIAFVAVTLLAVVSGSPGRSIRTMSPDAWRGVAHQRDEQNIGNSWPSFVDGLPASRTFDDYPVMCVELVQGQIVPSVSEQYFCTRFLISMHGLESNGSAILVPVLSSPVSDATILELDELSEFIARAPVLIIDEHGQVVDQISWAAFLQMLRAQTSGNE